ncbi:ABC transporter permease, partial [Acidobacteriota bacterium]
KIKPPRVRFSHFEEVKSQFKSHPSITGAAISWSVPGRMTNTLLAKIGGAGEGEGQSMHFQYIDADYIPEYKLEIIAGRAFRKGNRADIQDTFVLNEAAIRALGFPSPEDALGAQLYEGGSGNIAPIIGVVKDFHFRGLQNKIEPHVFQMNPRFFRQLTLTVKIKDLDQTLAFVEKTWRDINLGHVYSYYFLDEDFNKQYGDVERTGKIYATFASLAIFLSCLGLVGLSSFTTEQRTKEIGIRKALGSSTNRIVLMLISDFAKWIFTANLIAWPVSYFLLKAWLQGFAYRIPIEIWIFVLAFVLTMAIALLTVSFQTIRASLAAPSQSLRFE